MHTQQEHCERDELRARFTAWLTTVVYHAKLRYLEKESMRPEIVSLEEVPEIYWPSFTVSYHPKNDFDFEEERLADAYANLSMKRQQILTMLFVDQMKPAEIARHLHCTEQYVYDQRYQALKKLRIALTEKEDSHER